MPVAVQYVPPTGISRDGLARDLQSIRAMGFNAIETHVRWGDAEPFRGKYVFDAPGRVVAAAAQSDLRVIVRLDPAPPEWILRRYADGRRVPEDRAAAGARAGAQICFDHPGIREDYRSFVAAASEFASRTAALYAVDPFDDPPDGFCTCPHTAQRARQFASNGMPAREDFLRMSVRDDLKLMVDAARGARTVSRARTPSILRTAIGEPPQDDWLMSEVVHSYGTTIAAGLLQPERLALALDGMAAAGRQRGWWMRADASIPSADRRLAAWAAVSRGARMLTFAERPDSGTFEGVISRNPALFGELAPSRAAVALLFDPRGDASGIARAHAALFRRNIPVDVLHADEIAGSIDPARYRAVVVTSALELAPAVTERLKQFVASGGTVVNASDPSLSADRLGQLVSSAGVAPVVKIDGGQGFVETRFLESADVLMLIALNHGAASQKVTMTFAPDTQEAIWQNMETGAGVNFVAGPGGPTYEVLVCAEGCARPDDQEERAVARSVRLPPLRVVSAFRRTREVRLKPDTT